MCIRDSYYNKAHFAAAGLDPEKPPTTLTELRAAAEALKKVCLLYTSDAADERSSVDLGGRRIIKKKILPSHWVVCAGCKAPELCYSIPIL